MKDAKEATDSPENTTESVAEPSTATDPDAGDNGARDAAASSDTTTDDDSPAAADGDSPADGDAPGDGNDAATSDSNATASDEATQDKTTKKEEKARAAAKDDEGVNDGKGFWLWVVGIALILSLELFIYGHNGHVRVCVGVDGVTDWALKYQPKTPDNYRKAPMCAERLNLGMYSGTQEAAEGALDEACRRATMMNRKALPDCLRREKKWTRQVDKDQVFPWDERLYKRLFWME